MVAQNMKAYTDKGVDIEFSTNGTPSFVWKFMPYHFSVEAIRQGKEDWRDRVGVEAAKQLASSQLSKSNPLLLNLLSNSKNLEEMITPFQSNEGSATAEGFVYSLPLSSNDGKLLAIDSIYDSH